MFQVMRRVSTLHTPLTCFHNDINLRYRRQVSTTADLYFNCYVKRRITQNLVQETRILKNQEQIFPRSRRFYATTTEVGPKYNTATSVWHIFQYLIRSLTTHHARLFFDNVYPVKVGFFDLRYYIVRPSKEGLEEKVKSGKKWLPPEKDLPYDFKVTGVEPRRREGGMFVNFSFKTDPAWKTQALEDIREHVERHLENKHHVPWFSISEARAFLVKGEPFIEDLASRYPASRLRVEFQGPDVTTESLYNIFRPYGRIRDINVLPPSVKDLPRYATIQYNVMRAATSAKNCVHGKVVDGTRLSILYDRPIKTNLFTDWMAKHPRIAIPLIAALIAGITYIIFDPIRKFFIVSKATQRFNLQEYPLYQWLRRETIDRLWTKRKAEEEEGALADSWSERQEEEMKLQIWLKEPPETFIVLLGPRGSGKTAFINRVIENKKTKVVIKCDDILNSRDENEVVLKLAKQVGYFPVFAFLVAMSNIIDSLATITLGQKAGFTSTTDTEIKKILDELAIALHDIAPESIAKKPRPKEKNKGLHVSPIVEEFDPDEIPVVVIDSYMTKDKEKHDLWDHLAKLAVLLVENRVAHVIFVTSNIGAIKPLSKVLPTKTFNYVVLSDAPPDRAINLVKRHIGDAANIEKIEESVRTLGGRLTDLEIFISKIRGEALNDLIAKSIVEIHKYAFGDDAEDAKSIPWKGIQFWIIMKSLARGETVSYNTMKFSPIFNKDDTPLKAMEQAELITITQINGRPNLIRPGKPLYQAAFEQIASDKVFADTMELQTYEYLLSFETAKIHKYESELASLGQLLVKQDGKWIFGGGNVPSEVQDRVKFLLSLLHKKHVLTENYQTRVSALKKQVAAAGSS
ncbi:6946_t:CDS:10 [Ambispora gerdemannii]|uniref:Mitochondrial escape protein 2 n=1 Tax=Ambispora gerdemannii TaxID=144530 RepID=A0A9N8ZU75_9GLOM|nr:6946_t:CDS:10 [Ambispora gerdemannii]